MFDARDKKVINDNLQHVSSFATALTIDDIESALTAAHIAADGHFTLATAQQWNTTFEFPREAIAADTALFHQCNNDFITLCALKQSTLTGNRLSLQRVITTFGPTGQRYPTMLSNWPTFSSYSESISSLVSAPVGLKIPAKRLKIALKPSVKVPLKSKGPAPKPSVSFQVQQSLTMESVAAQDRFSFPPGRAQAQAVKALVKDNIQPLDPFLPESLIPASALDHTQPALLSAAFDTTTLLPPAQVEEHSDAAIIIADQEDIDNISDSDSDDDVELTLIEIHLLNETHVTSGQNSLLFQRFCRDVPPLVSKYPYPPDEPAFCLTPSGGHTILPQEAAHVMSR